MNHALGLPHLSTRHQRGCMHLALVLAVSSLLPRVAAAQQTPPPASDPVSFDAAQAAPTAPPVAPSAPQPDSPLLRAQAVTQQLVELEQRAIGIEQERARIRTVGLRIGKYITWSAFGVLAGTALGQWGRAEAVKEALDDGRSDKAYDTDGDGDVDRKDEQHSRRIARGLIIGSLVPLGLGIYTTVVGRMRQRHIRALDAQLDDLRDRRRGLLNNLSLELSAGRTHGQLGVRLAF